MIPDLSATRRTVPHRGHHAHRAPDPAPIEEPPSDPYEPADPHQPPIRTPQNDEPPVDPNPSVTLH
ncbi:hypothetical protein [Massilia sp.]|uniref:hypothetical protein n=1 Tax=Massilia sp. TaxID=1882437 RepID=UPI00352D06D1